jgi:hypothetical protein
MNKPSSKNLTAWITAADKQVPELAARQENGGLVLEWCGRRILLPEDRIGQYSREELGQMESPFLDLRTGLLSVTEPGVLIRLRIPIAHSTLTAKLSALLAFALLPRLPECETEATLLPRRLLLVGKQGLLAREWSREFGVDISTMTVNRLLAVMRDAGLLDDEPRDFGELPLERSLELLRNEFRTSGIGRRVFFRCGPEDLDALAERLGAGFARGTSFVLSQLTGGWLEPQDILVEAEALLTLREVLWPPVSSTEAPTLVVQAASRVALSLLAPVTRNSTEPRSINPILAACDGMASDDPVRRQLARQLWENWVPA